MMKPIGINQPYFFPYIGYFQLIHQVDTFVLYNQVKFSKRTWVTRNRIIDRQKDMAQYISIPVLAKSTIKEVELLEDNFDDWKRKLLKRVLHNYRRALHFEETFSLLESIIVLPSSTRLSSFNHHIIVKLCEVLNVTTRIINGNEIDREIEDKSFLFANENNLDIKTSRIITVCKFFGYSEYINLPNGRALYSSADFGKFGVKLSFLSPVIKHYPQFTKQFHSSLSIVDVLMHNGVEATSKMICGPQE